MDLRHLRRKSKAFQTHPPRRHSESRPKQEEATKPTKPQAARRKSMAAAKSDPLSPPAPETAAIAAQTQAAATRMVAAASGKEIVSPAQDGGPGSPLSRPKSHLRSFAVAVVVVVLAIVLATVSLLSLTLWTRKVERAVRVCRSQGCQVFADAFKHSMRRDVPPCINFVEFVCGGYGSGSSAKNKSVREAAYEAFRNDLILPSHNESLVSYQSQNTLQKAWVFYKTCEDVVSAGADNAKTVLAMMKEAKLTWPARSARPDAVYSLLCLQGKLAWPTPLEYTIEDLGIGELHVTFSLSPDVGKYALERKRRLEKRAEHANFFKNLVAVFGQDSEGGAIIDFDTTMTLEANHIRAIANSSPHAPSGSPNAFTSDAWRTLEQRWQSSLGTIFPGRVRDNTKLTYATVDQAWFERLLALIVADESTLVLMLGWRVAQYASQYVNRDLALGYYKDDKEPTKSYLDHCFDLFSDHMGLASIKDYVAKHFTKDSRDDLIHIARGVRRIFFEKLTDSSYDWKNVSALYGLLESSQSPSLNDEFLQLPTMSASFPDNLRRVKVLLQDNPDVATAIYAHRLSSDLYRRTSYYFHKGKEGSVRYAMLPLALNFPFYEPDAPLAVRYGSLGTSLGSLTARIFYAEAQKTAVPPSIDRFRKCIEKNGGAEITVFMSGIKMAHKVFLEQMRAASGAGLPQQLEGLEDLSPHQLFFVAVVYRHCGGADVSYGNAMLRLMSGFSEAYGCGKDSPMRGPEFCDQID